MMLPRRTRKPWWLALLIPAIIAAGVASTNAHGQNTTRIVTERIISPVTIYVQIAASNAITTIHVAQRSAIPTILALPGSTDCTSLIIR